jgi:transposase
MAKKRRKYSAEFKAEAVKLVLEQDLSATQAAKDLGIAQSVLSRWVALARREAQPGAITAAERDELMKLRRENDILRQERDILKKAAAFFAKEM